ncbi:MAG: DUF2723 domain-containing protein [Planctomycetes bacterium]|nr:DUF2723 domain-containing protein [Planctomycetota bacterium]
MVFAAAFALYFFTLCPAVWVGDSGELIAAAHVLGIPHPTGYPLWILLNKGFELLCPFGSVAWRMNLFSALCAASAAQVLASALRRLGCGRWPAAGGALAFACLAPIWGEATVARTYPLAAFCCAVMWWCVARLIADGAPKWLLAHQLVLGIGLANHAMVVAQVPVVLLVLLTRRRELLRRPSVLAAALLAMLPGLALYGWIPWRAAADPPLEFRVALTGADGVTRTAELEDPSALRSYLSREAHHARQWAQDSSDHLTIVRHHLGEVVREWNPLGSVLLLAGAIACWRGRRRVLVGAVLLAWSANLLPLALHGAWWDLFLYSRYMTGGWMALALLVAFGLDALCAWPRYAAALARPAARAGVALALPALLLAMNWRACDRRDAWLAHDYGQALLAELPEGAQYIGSGDVALYPLFELHFAEGERPDLSIVSRAQLKGEADLVLERDALRSGTPAPATRRPLFTADLSAGAQERFKMERRGLLWRLKSSGTPAEPRAPYSAPVIRGLDRDELDPFARSVIGAIEADLADAAAVRGDRAQARTRLEKVVALRCRRPWGALIGIETLLRLANQEQSSAKSAEEHQAAAAPFFNQAREDLLLAEQLARGALEHGDSRELSPRLQARQIAGWLGYLDAQEFRTSEPPRGLEGFRRAAEFLDLAEIAAAYVSALLKVGQRDEAITACSRYCIRFPASEALQRLTREIGVTPSKPAGE